MKKLLIAFLLLSQVVLGQKQTAPRPQGNWFVFTPQLAKNTLLVSRFPTGWTVPQTRPFIMGFGVPFTSNIAENNRRFTNAGFTHAERDIFVNRLSLPISKRFRMLRDAEAAAQAGVWAASLPGSDSRKAPLQAYASNHSITSQDWSLWQELGKRTYNAYKGSGYGLVGFDIETFADGTDIELIHQFSRACNLGMALAITENGDPTRIFQYGGSLADVVTYNKNWQNNDLYMRVPGTDWRGSDGNFDLNANALVTYYRTHGAYVGRDQYARRTWDNRSLWQKNSDGSIKVDGSGNPLMVKLNYPNDQLTNFGVQKPGYTYEALYWTQQWYEEMEKILTDMRWLCNTPILYDGLQTVGSMPYPKGTYDLRPGMAGLGISSWYRDDTETEAMWNPDISAAELQPENIANRRPLNPECTRFQVLMRSIFYQANILWSDKAYADFTQGAVKITEEGGQNVTKPNLVMGQYEMMIAGNYQGKNFPKLFTLWDQGGIDFIWPKRFIYKGNFTVGEREIDKPIVTMQKEHGGRTVFAQWVYPVQDMNNTAHEIDIKGWIVLDNGTTSGSWTMHCANRATGYDAWMLPAGFENAKPENFRFQFTNLLGQKFTWTGNYNVPFTGSNPTPPAAITRTVITTTTSH